MEKHQEYMCACAEMLKAERYALWLLHTLILLYMELAYNTNWKRSIAVLIKVISGDEQPPEVTLFLALDRTRQKILFASLSSAS